VLRVLDAGDAEEVEQNCAENHEDGAEKAAKEESAEKGNVAEVGDAAGVGRGDEFKGRDGGGGLRQRSDERGLGEGGRFGGAHGSIDHYSFI
jgi:hypothetical protein